MRDRCSKWGGWTGFAAVLLVGAIMLFQRSIVGRGVVVAGCALSILGSLASLIFGAAVGEIAPGSSCGVIFPIITIVLALLPSTTQWIRAKHAPTQPTYPAPYYH